MQLATVSETVVVTAESSPIDLVARRHGRQYRNEVKETLPTISRSLTDIVRTNPYFNPMGNDAGDALGVRWRAPIRYNALQIDGAVNNDLFGLAGRRHAGRPGGHAADQPRRDSGAAAGRLAVRRPAERLLGRRHQRHHQERHQPADGTVFFFGRNQAWVGKGVDDAPIADFKDKQGGFSVGGPLVAEQGVLLRQHRLGPQDNADRLLVTAPARSSATRRRWTASSASWRTSTATIPGRNRSRSSQDDRHRQVLRPRSTSTSAESPADGPPQLRECDERHRLPEPDDLPHAGRLHRFSNKTNSTVGQLNSTFGKGVNEFRVAFTPCAIAAGQPFEQPVPAHPVVLTGTFDADRRDRGLLRRERARPGHHRDPRRLHDDQGQAHDHARHAQRVLRVPEPVHPRQLRHLHFNTLDMFEQGLAQQFDHSFSATRTRSRPRRFNVNQFGFYVGDPWRVSRD